MTREELANYIKNLPPTGGESLHRIGELLLLLVQEDALRQPEGYSTLMQTEPFYGILRTVGSNIVDKAYEYRDELGDLTKLKKVGNRITDDNAEGTVVFATNCTTEDYLITNVQLNHDRDHTSPIYPHLHWFQAENHQPRWLLQYRWQVNGSAKVTSWSNLPTTGNAFDYTTGTILNIAKFGSINVPEDTNVSDIVQFRIIRDTANASKEFTGVGDPYTAVAHALSFDIHIKVDTLGSYSEYVKYKPA